MININKTLLLDLVDIIDRIYLVKNIYTHKKFSAIAF